MSELLNPCPFCGGEAKMHAAFAHGAASRVGAYVECVSCGAWSKTHWGDGAQEKTAEAWNRRAERTCRIIEDMCGLAHCSECGYEFDPYDCSGIPEEGVPYEYDGRYCKNCGAKVVDK